jgi:hypothetical protein
MRLRNRISYSTDSISPTGRFLTFRFQQANPAPSNLSALVVALSERREYYYLVLCISSIFLATHTRLHAQASGSKPNRGPTIDCPMVGTYITTPNQIGNYIRTSFK